MTIPRYLSKMVSIDGATSYTFPTALYSWTRSQSLRSAVLPIAGAHYPFDQLGIGRSIKDQKAFQVSALIKAATGALVDTELDTMDYKLAKIGGGKIYILDSAAAERWCYGRMARSMPAVNWKTGNLNFTNFQLNLEAYSDWYSTTAFAGGPYTLDASPKAVTINNTGNERVYNAVFTLKGSTTGTAVITNTTNGYALEIARTLGVGQWERFDAGAGSVEYSSDAGGTYTGDFDNFTFPTGQIQLMVLEPGNNVFSITGCVGGTLAVSFYPAFA